MRICTSSNWILFTHHNIVRFTASFTIVSSINTWLSSPTINPHSNCHCYLPARPTGIDIGDFWCSAKDGTPLLMTLVSWSEDRLRLFCCSNWTSDKNISILVTFLFACKDHPRTKLSAEQPTRKRKMSQKKSWVYLPQQEIEPLSCHHEVPSIPSRLSVQIHVWCLQSLGKIHVPRIASVK